MNMKIAFYTFGGIILTLVLVIGIFYFYKTSLYGFKSYLLNNPDKFSLTVSINDSIVANHNSEKVRYLASTRKLIVLIEYAHQLEDAIINENEIVPMSNVDLFYIEDTDGNAHNTWKENSEKKNTKQIALKDIVEGMIIYSSNACTDYLIDRLTIDKINARIDSLGLKFHDKMIYNAPLFFMDSSQLSLVNYNNFIHSQENIVTLLKDPISRNKLLNTEKEFDIDLIVSKTPKSTSYDYHSIMQKINKNEFRGKVAEKIKQDMSMLKHNLVTKSKKKKDIYKYLGGKGGSHINTLTFSTLIVAKNNDVICYTMFLNDLEFYNTLLFQLKPFFLFVKEFSLEKQFREDFLVDLKKATKTNN